MAGANDGKAGLIESISAAVVVHDADTRITRCNAAAQGLLGLTEAQLLGKDSADPAWRFLRADGTAMPAEEYPVNRVLADQQPLQDLILGIQRPDSPDIAWVLVGAVPVSDPDGGLSRVVVTFMDISLQKRAEAELRRARREWEGIFQAIGQPAMILDPEHGVVTANRAVVRLTGMSAEDLRGKKCYEVFHHTGEAPRGCPFEKMLSSGRLETVEMEMEALGRVFLVSCTPMVDDRGNLERVIHIATDVTEQRQAAEALRMTQSAVDRTSVAVFWIEPHARFLYVNDAACRSLGYSRDELLAMTVHDIDPDFPREVWAAHWEDLRRAGSMTFESRHRRKDGRTFPVEITINYLKFDGRECNFAFAQDISERRHLQQQLLYAQKLDSISTLAAGVAHNFNNILTAILGNVELARRGTGRTGNLERAMEAVDRGAQLTKQLLSFSRRECGAKTAVSVAKLLDSVSQTLGAVLDSNIQVTCRVSDDAAHALANFAEIEQVLMNICLNAQEAMPKGGVLGIHANTVNLPPEYCRAHESMVPGEHIRISVRDTGTGMDEETLARIFDPFFTTKGPDRGTGLGLSSAYQAVARHGGAIEVASEVGRGTTFTVYLPATEKPEGDVARAEAAEPVGGNETVLVVDDDEMVLSMLEESLVLLGYTVLTAGNGKDAVDIYRQGRDRIDLVLLDYMMPGMDGEDAYGELRKINADVRVLVISGYDEESKVKPLLEAGVDGFIQKPVDLCKLSRAVRNVLDEP